METTQTKQEILAQLKEAKTQNNEAKKAHDKKSFFATLETIEKLEKILSNLPKSSPKVPKFKPSEEMLSFCNESALHDEELLKSVQDTFLINEENAFEVIAKSKIKTKSIGVTKETSSYLPRITALGIGRVAVNEKTATLSTLDKGNAIGNFVAFVNSHNLINKSINESLLDKLIKENIGEKSYEEAILAKIDSYETSHNLEKLDRASTLKTIEQAKARAIEWNKNPVRGILHRLWFGFDFGSLCSLMSGKNHSFVWQRERVRVMLSVKSLELQHSKEGKTNTLKLVKIDLSKLKHLSTPSQVISSAESHKALKDIKAEEGQGKSGKGQGRGKHKGK